MTGGENKNMSFDDITKLSGLQGNILAMKHAITPELKAIRYSVNSDSKVIKITNAIENMNDINRIRELDKLYYQIEIKKRQKSENEKKLKSINSALRQKGEIYLSILIVIFSVIIPFLIVMFQEYLQAFQKYIFMYLIATFICSMVSIIIYLYYFLCKK